MSRFPRLRRTALRTFGPLAAILCWGAIPTAAFATCGDWLSHAAGRDVAPAKVSQDFSIDEDLPLRRPACDGPSCRRGPNDRPAAPAVPAPESSADQPAWLIGAMHADGSGPGGFGRISDSGNPRYVPFAPDRPPCG